VHESACVYLAKKTAQHRVTIAVAMHAFCSDK